MGRGLIIQKPPITEARCIPGILHLIILQMKMLKDMSYRANQSLRNKTSILLIA